MLNQIICEQLAYQPEFPETRLLIAEVLASSSDNVFVCVDEGIAVGFIHITTYRIFLVGVAINIMGLAVSSDYQHQGIGRELMQLVEDDARKRSIHTIRLNSGIEREDAHRFYQKLGRSVDKTQFRLSKHFTWKSNEEFEHATVDIE
ncbi:GNAT family N-acetyltransferase [Lacticaseibacillus jixiensis]|uniref:GNAT family N-acetyltransferase n=1 Tax=Lacticaseibacillus jixiensis TaxID=3231926 RepID=UPI0036F2644C